MRPHLATHTPRKQYPIRLVQLQTANGVINIPIPILLLGSRLGIYLPHRHLSVLQ